MGRQALQAKKEQTVDKKIALKKLDIAPIRIRILSQTFPSLGTYLPLPYTKRIPFNWGCLIALLVLLYRIPRIRTRNTPSNNNSKMQLQQIF